MFRKDISSPTAGSKNTPNKKIEHNHTWNVSITSTNFETNRIMIFWVATPCSFGGIYYSYLQGSFVCGNNF